MNLFSKVLSRAEVPGISQAVPAYPKGTPLPLRRAEEEEEAQALRRVEEEEEAAQPLRRAEEEETAQPLRRAKNDEVEEEAQPLRRMEEEEAVQPVRRAEEEEEAQALRRVEEEEETAQSLRRAEEEEEVQALRRVEEEEEAAQPLRRAEEEEETVQPLRRAGTGEVEEEAQPLRRLEEEEEAVQPLRRTEPPDEEMPSEPNPLQALHPNTSMPAFGPGDSPQLASGMEPDIQSPFAAFEPGFQATDESTGPTAAPPPERPRVQIDQIDVVIHEDTPRASGRSENLSGDLARRMRSTYLRGL